MEEKERAKEASHGKLKATFLNVERTLYVHQSKIVFKVLTSREFSKIGDFLQFRLVTLPGRLAVASEEVDLFAFHLQSGVSSMTLPC